MRRLQRARTDSTPSVYGWRVEQLQAAGFARRTAEALACDRDYDLHAILGLIDHGCPPHLALRILAPLDAGRDPVGAGPARP
jgi:hypothetical protein